MPCRGDAITIISLSAPEDGDPANEISLTVHCKTLGVDGTDFLKNLPTHEVNGSKDLMSNTTIQHFEYHKNIIYIKNKIVAYNILIFKYLYCVCIVVQCSMFSLRSASK